MSREKVRQTGRQFRIRNLLVQMDSALKTRTARKASTYLRTNRQKVKYPPARMKTLTSRSFHRVNPTEIARTNSHLASKKVQIVLQMVTTLYWMRNPRKALLQVKKEYRSRNRSTRKKQLFKSANKDNN